MSRWQAAGIHVGITVVVAILVGTLLFGIWYPPPYFGAGGADHLMIVLVSVDLTIGPLLTLIVFKSGKWGMRFDLWVIALLQVTALGYGLSVMAKSRPIFLVGNIDRFVLVPSNAIEDADIAKGHADEYRTRSWTGAQLVGASIPDEAARQKLISAAFAGLDIENFPEYYVPYGDRRAGTGQARQTARDAAQEGWRQHRRRLAGPKPSRSGERRLAAGGVARLRSFDARRPLDRAAAPGLSDRSVVDQDSNSEK